MADRVSSGEASVASTTFVGGPVAAGEVVRISYANDEIDAEGNDRNLWISGLRIEP